MLICYAAAAAVPTPYPAALRGRAANPHCRLQLRSIPSLVPWLVPPNPAEDRSLPSSLVVANNVTAKLMLPWQPSAGLVASTWETVFLPAYYSIHHLWVFAATELHNRSDLLICPPGRDLLTENIFSFCPYLLQDPLVSPITQEMCHQAAHCLRSRSLQPLSWFSLIFSNICKFALSLSGS